MAIFGTNRTGSKCIGSKNRIGQIFVYMGLAIPTFPVSTRCKVWTCSTLEPFEIGPTPFRCLEGLVVKLWLRSHGTGPQMISHELTRDRDGLENISGILCS